MQHSEQRKGLNQNLSIFVVQKYKSGIPDEKSWVGRTSLVKLQQIFTQKIM